MIALKSACLVFGMVVMAFAPAYGATGIDANCDIQRAPCGAVTDSGLEVLFSISPRPVRVMEDLEFTMMLTRKGKPVSGAIILLDLSMPGMFMGSNQPKLKEEMPGRYRGRGVIPRCVTGQRTWQAFIAVRHSGIVDKITFLFEVQ